MVLDHYKEKFSQLKRATIAGVKAPHKPILLLSIIDLIEQGNITNNYIELNDILEHQFAYNWRVYIGGSLIFQAKIATPFWHLQNEPFWELISKDGSAVSKSNFKGSFYSVKNLREQLVFARIDIELLNLLKSQESRDQLRNLLISAYLVDGATQIKDIVHPILTISLLLTYIA